MECILLGCGNPLLDMQVRVENDSFLRKWELKENNAILATDKHIEMFHEIDRDHDVEYVPGGSTLNTLRVCQWILGVHGAVVYFGAIGNDKFGRILKEKSLKSGVDARFQINNGIKSGTCAVIVHSNKRSLCADLAAANTFTIDHLNQAENRKLIENAKFFYASGFFLTVSPDAILELAKHSAEKKKKMCMNLGAPFILQHHLQDFLKILPYINVLFGNSSEYLAFAEAHKMETTDLNVIARRMAQMPAAEGQERLIIITQDSDPTIVANADSVEQYPVVPLLADEIVDTNAAGDAFTGGFLAQYVRNKSIKEAIACAHYAAREIIKQEGCTIPEKCEYLCASHL